MHLRPESDATLERASLFIDTWAIMQGPGQRLWDYAMAYARESSYREVTLEADPNAEPFYFRQGAVITGTRASALMRGGVLNIMTITLDPPDTREEASGNRLTPRWRARSRTTRSRAG